MNKDILVLLLQKDIKELSLLTEGFEKLTEFPEPLLRLAKEKTENLLDTLNELTRLAEPELGAIDNESFGEKEEEHEEREPIFEEKNNFDAPLDSVLEPPVNPHEIEMDEIVVTSPAETNEEEEGDEYVEKEYELDRAADVEEVVQDEEVVASEKEIEVPEIISHEELVDLEVENEYEIETTNEVEEEVQIEIPQEEKKEGPITIQTNSTLNDALTGEDNSLSTNLANQKIEDIRLAINIGDRFRFQRELFGGNGEVLNKTISYLNQLSKFSEAESFLKSKFGWADDNIHAEEFLQIVKRRYL